MEKYYCLDILFKDVNAGKFLSCSKVSQKTYHAHLYLNENGNNNDIELRILFEPDTFFEIDFYEWYESIKPNKFGSSIVVSNENKNNSLQKIDLSKSSLIGARYRTNQLEDNFGYFSIWLDSIILYWNPNPKRINTGDFYLHDEGFKVVSNYYTPLLGIDGKFDITRMQNQEDFYCLGKSQYRPEFEFEYSDSRNENKTTITKVPKIHFKYNSEITEQDTILYADIVKSIISFYFHFNIDFYISKIYLKNYTISIKKLHTTKDIDQPSGFYGFKNSFTLDKFLQANWQDQALMDHKKIRKVIELFNQSHIVDYGIRLLIRFNIIEICMGGKKSAEPKFTEIISKEEKNKKYNEALSIILETVNKDEHQDFENKWKGVINKLEYKPIKSPIEAFLKNNGLPIDEFPVTISELKKIRDNLTHGSIDRIDPIKLERSNMFMYRISGILILCLLGIKDWELDKDL